MAKIKHPNVNDIIDESFSHGVKRKVLHLHADKVLDGRKIIVNGKELLHFGNCNYLGLEQHPKVKQAAINAINEEGIRFTMSRTYASSGMYKELEKLLGQMFDAHAVVAPSSTMLHLSTIPVLMESDDLIILDHQVHASMRNAVQYIKTSGVKVRTIRHSDYGMLEKILIENHNRYKKIWYLVDGVYSMYGDCPDMQILTSLLDKYSYFNLYVDDAHGTSWAGKNGRGYVLDQVDLHERMMLTVSLGKGYGVIGGVLVSKNPEPIRRVKTCGQTLIFSAPLSSGLLGAAIESAKIHLSPELKVLQDDIMEKIDYCNQLLHDARLPLIKKERSPIFYLGMGTSKGAYNMLERLINDGFLVNIAGFPAVPQKCAGIRFLITCHLQKEDIKMLVDRFAFHLPKVLQEENYDYSVLADGFNRPDFKELENYYPLKKKTQEVQALFNLKMVESIKHLEPEEWNKLMGNKGPYSVNCLKTFEDIFKSNKEEHHNWRFLYYTIRDKNNQLVLATFLTVADWKDDVLSPDSISRQLEDIRTKQPDYMVSKALLMGHQGSDGTPFYIDYSNPNWQQALDLLIKNIWAKQEELDLDLIAFRDFSVEDSKLSNYFLDKGFMKLQLPHAHFIENFDWNSTEEYLERLSKKKRTHLRRFALKHEDEFIIKRLTNPNKEELDRIYDLYLNVKRKNLGLNTFDLPRDYFKICTANPNSYLFAYYLKDKNGEPIDSLPQGFYTAFMSQDVYVPLFLGIDYKYLKTHALYRLILYRLVQDAKKLGARELRLGFSATIEKQKLGSIVEERVGFFQYRDNFKQEVLRNMDVNKIAKHY